MEAFPDLVICEHLQDKTGCAKGDANCPFVDNWEGAGQLCSDYKAKGLQQLEVGDYFTGVTWWQTPEGNTISQWKGHLVEIKIGADFGLHTEPLERFQDECYRMSCWRQQNPHVVVHAVWLNTECAFADGLTIAVKNWYHTCQKYGIWGHVVFTPTELVEFLKALDQPSQYIPFEPFLKKSHEEPTLLARMLRQIPDISSLVAIELAACKAYEQTLKVKGMRKLDGSPTKRFGKFNATLVLLQDYINEVFS